MKEPLASMIQLKIGARGLLPHRLELVSLAQAISICNFELSFDHTFHEHYLYIATL